MVDPAIDTAHSLAFAGGMFVASCSIPLVLLSDVPRSKLSRDLLFCSTYRTLVPLGFGTFLIGFLPDLPPVAVVVAALLLVVGAVVVGTSFPPVLLRRIRGRGDGSPPSNVVPLKSEQSEPPGKT